jgi:hypothetical protein
MPEDSGSTPGTLNVLFSFRQHFTGVSVMGFSMQAAVQDRKKREAYLSAKEEKERAEQERKEAEYRELVASTLAEIKDKLPRQGVYVIPKVRPYWKVNAKCAALRQFIHNNPNYSVREDQGSIMCAIDRNKLKGGVGTTINISTDPRFQPIRSGVRQSKPAHR